MKGRKCKGEESVILKGERTCLTITGKHCWDGEAEEMSSHLPLLLSRPACITAIPALDNAPGTFVQGTEELFRPTCSLNEKRAKFRSSTSSQPTSRDTHGMAEPQVPEPNCYSEKHK